MFGTLYFNVNGFTLKVEGLVNRIFGALIEDGVETVSVGRVLKITEGRRYSVSELRSDRKFYEEPDRVGLTFEFDPRSSRTPG